MQVRAMIHSWEKYGLQAAASEHFTKYNYKNKQPKDLEQSFINEVIGKLGHIKFIQKYNLGEELFDSSVYQRLADRINALSPTTKLYYHVRALSTANKPMLICEGKTDWMLIETALLKFQSKGDYKDLNIDYRKYEGNESAGADSLASFCKLHNIADLPHLGICLFDRDKPNINTSIFNNASDFRSFGHNICALLLPIPSFRTFNEICIEQLFSDEDIMTKDSYGRRLYLSTEFDSETGIHKLNSSVYYQNKKHLQSTFPRILDTGVFDSNTGHNIALPKRDFAYYFQNGEGDFNNLSIEGFRPLFERLREILSTPHPTK